MNPMTNMKNVKKLSEQELHTGFKTSWHDQYRDSAWIFVGGLPYDLTEGDLICVFSQYGEIVNLNLIRDKETGKQKGFCFICFEDQRSTDLAVDNFNGIKILKRTVRVDHVSNYKVPKEFKNADNETRQLQNEGCGPNVKPVKPAPAVTIVSTELPSFAKETEAPPDGFRLPPRLPIGTVKPEPGEDEPVLKKVKKEKKSKKDKKHKKKSKKKRKKSSSTNDSDSSESKNSSSDSSDDEQDVSKSRDNKKFDKKRNEIKKEDGRPDSSRRTDDSSFRRPRNDYNKYRERYDEKRREYEKDKRYNNYYREIGRAHV